MILWGVFGGLLLDREVASSVDVQWLLGFCGNSSGPVLDGCGEKLGATIMLCRVFFVPRYWLEVWKFNQKLKYELEGKIYISVFDARNESIAIFVIATIGDNICSILLEITNLLELPLPRPGILTSWQPHHWNKIGCNCQAVVASPFRAASAFHHLTPCPTRSQFMNARKTLPIFSCAFDYFYILQIFISSLHTAQSPQSSILITHKPNASFLPLLARSRYGASPKEQTRSPVRASS